MSTASVLASNGGVASSVLGWAFTVTLLAVALFVLVGIVLLPVWGVGAAVHDDRLTRWGRGWWLLPWVGAERARQLIDGLTRPRDASRYARPSSRRSEVASPRQTDWAHTLGQLALWGLAIVGALMLFMTGHDAVVRPLAGGETGVDIAVLAVLCTTAAAGTGWVLSRRYQAGSRPPAFRLCVAATIVLGLFAYSVITELQYSHRLVSDYCAYGAVSDTQLASCKSHVTANDVRARDTSAARFADSGSDAVCGGGSGPFCQAVLNRRSLEDQAPPPGQ